MAGFEPFIDTHAVASLLGIYHKKVQRLARTGVLPCIRVGSAYRFRESTLEAWVSSQTQSAPPASKVQQASARWTGERRA